MFRSRVFYFFLLSPNLSQGCSTLHSRNERLLATKSQNNQKRSGRNGKVGLSCIDEQNIRRQHSENWTKISSTPEVLRETAGVQLVWLSDLSMEMELDKNTTDMIILAPTSKETVCLFSGKLEKDQESMVTVSGCKGDKEVMVSIASKRIPGGFAVLVIFEGTTFKVNVKVRREGSSFESSSCLCTNGQISCTLLAPSTEPAIGCLNDRTGKRVPQKSASNVEQSRKMCACLDSQINCSVLVRVIKRKAELQLTWLTETSMEIRLANGTTEEIQLRPVPEVPGYVPSPCLFSGKVGKDQVSGVYVRGCRDNSYVSVTVSSKLLPRVYYKLFISQGNTYDSEKSSYSYGQPKICACLAGKITCNQKDLEIVK